MTHETKIGLLVGLAFIIVVGILLEDQASKLTEPKPADRSSAGNNVRQGAPTPGSSSAGAAVVTPIEVAPRNNLPTPEELNNQEKLRQIRQAEGGRDGSTGGGTVVIGPGGERIPRPGTGGGERVAVGPGETRGPGDTPRTGGGTLEEVARGMGEPIERPGDRREPRPDTPGAVKTYKAEKGDNLSTMATKVYGVNTKPYREAIVKANPSLQQDPNKVVAGKLYNMPPAASIVVPPASPADGGTAPIPPPTSVAGGGSDTRTPAPDPVASGADNVYTTKAGDTLWRIAAEQCGSGSAVSAIKELNKDKLNGSDTIFPNMKLKLPPRAVASAR